MKTKKMIFALLAVMMVVMFASAAMADTITITGVVEMTSDGAVINFDGKTFILDGDSVEDWEGKTVKATGEMEEGENGEVYLVVTNVVELVQ